VNEYWDQPRIAREFGIAVNTVQSSWRNATLKALREHIAEHIADLPDDSSRTAEEIILAVGLLERLTRARWHEICKLHGIRPLKLPGSALPLPDTVFGSKPGWTERSIRAWAADTKRVDADGALRRGSPPGRPAGVVEQRPRRKQDRKLGVIGDSPGAQIARERERLRRQGAA
jgi:hypothetical protein